MNGSTKPRPRCYDATCGRRVTARRVDHGQRFCSEVCAAKAGEIMASGGLDYWCEACGAWVAPMDCPHRFAGVQQAFDAGRTHRTASA